MAIDLFELNCPFCDKLYKLPREKVAKHVGKSIHCRRCGKVFSIPALPPDDIPIATVAEVPFSAVAVEPPAIESPAVEEPAPFEAVGFESASSESEHVEAPPIELSPVLTHPPQEIAIEVPAIEQTPPPEAPHFFEHAEHAAPEPSWMDSASTESSFDELPAQEIAVEEPHAGDDHIDDPPQFAFADYSPLAPVDVADDSAVDAGSDSGSDSRVDSGAAGPSDDTSEDDPEREHSAPMMIAPPIEHIEAPSEDAPIAPSEAIDEEPFGGALGEPIEPVVDEPADSEPIVESLEIPSFFTPTPLAETAPSVIPDEAPVELEAPSVEEASPEWPLKLTFPEAALSDQDESATVGETINEQTETTQREPEPADIPPIDAPASPPPPVPLIMPPKRRARARTAVAPVFDATSEEPQPRVRGRLVENADAIVPIDPPPAKSSQAPDDLSKLQASISDPDEIEASGASLIDRSSTDLSEQTEDAAIPGALDSPTDATDSALAASTSRIPALKLSAMRMPNSEQALADLSAIRRFMGLVAVMSVVIALVLVAMLLAMMGILPKK